LARIPPGIHGQPLHQFHGGVRGTPGEPEAVPEGLPLGMPRAGRPLVLGQHRLGEAAGQRPDLQGGRDDQRRQDRIALLRHGGGGAPAVHGGFGDLGHLGP
jgi:hypothetical protein